MSRSGRLCSFPRHLLLSLAQSLKELSMDRPPLLNKSRVDVMRERLDRIPLDEIQKSANFLMDRIEKLTREEKFPNEAGIRTPFSYCDYEAKAAKAIDRFALLYGIE